MLHNRSNRIVVLLAIALITATLLLSMAAVTMEQASAQADRAAVHTGTMLAMEGSLDYEPFVWGDFPIEPMPNAFAWSD
jgi:hypothetical protein